MAQGARLRLRLFIEGIEVPIIAASVSASPNTPAAAAIQIIPTDTSFFFKPRTVVHLFFYDYLGKRPESDDRSYKQLFAGELVAMSFMKDVQSRNMVLQCLDFTNIWDHTHQYYFNLGSDNADLDGRLAQIGGQSQASFNDILSPLIIIQKLINEGADSNNLPRSFPGLTGLLGGILHLIESLTGVPGDGKINGNAVNPFFVSYNLRTRLTDQFFASVKDTTSAKLFQLLAINEVIQKDLGQAGYRLSLREIINTLLGYVYFSAVSIPTPKYVKDGSKVTATSLKGQAKSERDGFLLRKKLLDQVIDEVANARGIKVTRVKGTPSTAGLRTSSAKILTRDIILSHPTTTARLLDKNDKKAFMQELEEIDSLPALIRIRNSQEAELNKIVADDNIVIEGRRDRLRSIVFRPDIYFMPPPKCNVLFPEMYDQFNWSRDLLSEPSRILVDTSHYLVDQNDPFFRALKLRAIGPNSIPSINGRGGDPSDGIVGADPEKQKTLILPHEQFTGIIMERRTFPDIAVYFARSLLKREGRANGVPIGTTSDLNVPYLRDATNFEFFRSRFQTRSLNLAGRFNPFVVPGFPALILDKLRTTRKETRGSEKFKTSSVRADRALDTVEVESSTSPTADTTVTVKALDPEDPETQFQTGVHFLGMVARMQHAVNQQGGNTFVDISHAHLHNEATGFGREQDFFPGEPGAALTTASIEDFLFPPWFDDIYKPENIGQFYREAFGAGSIMLDDRNVIFQDFAASPSPEEISQSSSIAASAFDNPKQVKNNAAKSKQTQKALRKKLHTQLVLSVSLKIFDIQTGAEKIIADFSRQPDLHFNAEAGERRDPASEIRTKLEAQLSAARIVDTRINRVEPQTLTFSLEGDETAISAGQGTLATLVENLEQAVEDAKQLEAEEIAEDELIEAAKKLEEQNKSAVERENIKPRNFKNDVRRSVEAIASEYARRVASGQDISEFVNSFVYREIADLQEMLGFEFPPAVGQTAGPIPRWVEGFFSFAFGGAELPEINERVKLLTTTGSAASPKDVLDPRPERFRLALKYKEEVDQGGGDNSLLAGAAVG